MPICQFINFLLCTLVIIRKWKLTIASCFFVNQLIVGELVCLLSSMLTVVVVVSDGVIANLFCLEALIRGFIFPILMMNL